MPHTSRKHRGPWHSKRVNVEGDDGWTVVATTSQPPRKPAPLLPTPGGPAPIPSGCSLETIAVEYEKYQKIWQLSKSGAGVSGILDRVPKGRLMSGVCLGLGSIVDPISKKHALYQLAALMSIVSSLGESSQGCSLIEASENDVEPSRDSPMTLFAQDPIFNALDIDFLSSLDVTTVESPDAFDMIAESTFVYAPHCERSFFFPGIIGRDPSLVICNSMEQSISGQMSGSISAEDKAIAQGFLRGRVSYEFPVFHEDETVFNDLRIYIKEDSSAD